MWGLAVCIFDAAYAARTRVGSRSTLQHLTVVGDRERDESMNEIHQRYNSSKTTESMAAVVRKPIIAEPYAECPYACQNGKDFAITLQLKQESDYAIIVNIKRKVHRRKGTERAYAVGAKMPLIKRFARKQMDKTV